MYIDLEGYAAWEWRALPEQSFSDKYLGGGHAKDIYRGLVHGTPVRHYGIESARTDAAMDAIYTTGKTVAETVAVAKAMPIVGRALASVPGAQSVTKWAGKASAYAASAASGITDVMPEVVKRGAKAIAQTTAKVTGEVRNAADKIEKKILQKFDVSHLGNTGSVNFEKIIATPKGDRSNPSEYLSPGYISDHIAQFEDGATRFMTESNLKKYGIGQRDGTAFVMPKNQADKMLSTTKGNAQALEDALGLPEGFLESNRLVRIDIPKPQELNIRIPSGNEAGANDLWIPGGKLPNGNSEAVVDVGDISPSRYFKTPL